MKNFYNDYIPEPEILEEIWSEDDYQEEAEVDIRNLYENDKKGVYYSRQLCIKFEEKYYHWVTERTVRYLKDLGYLKLIIRERKERGSINFYIHHSNRYPKRKINEIEKIINEYSEERISRSCGKQAENLFCLGLVKKGFRVIAEEAREFQGKKWEKTEHDLDFIFERDEIYYGCEIKNTLDYIDKDEFDIKIEMCEFFNIRPLFIMRYAPKTWIAQNNSKKGYCMIFETKIFELSQIELVEKIKNVLGLPVICSRAIPDGIITRFENWHKRQISVNSK